MILMLEDDQNRVDRFGKVIRAIAPDLRLIVWRNAYTMGQEVGEFLSRARLISLDHDLEPGPGDPPDLGDGVVVAKTLVAHRQTCPVIIHSSNMTRSDWMTGEFELAGWTSRRAAPIGEYWIEEHWRIVARELLGIASLANRRERSALERRA